jgi:hypothetical protein
VAWSTCHLVRACDRNIHITMRTSGYSSACLGGSIWCGSMPPTMPGLRSRVPGPGERKRNEWGDRGGLPIRREVKTIGLLHFRFFTEAQKIQLSGSVMKPASAASSARSPVSPIRW